MIDLVSILPSNPQNLNFGPTNTSNIATTHNPPIHAYSIIRPHQPFPSLILFNNPILFPAASIPVAFLSSPSVARFRVSVSVASEAENWVLEALSAWARVKRLLVRLADSVSLWARRSA